MNDPDFQGALEYLSHFGYLPPTMVGVEAEQDATVLEMAIQEFQANFGLATTGTLDTPTLRAMAWPRCGVTDALTMHYAIEEARWRGKDLTYFIESYVAGIAPSDQDDLLKLAWNSWESVADLRLTRVPAPQNANIVISTGKGRGANFDGPGNTLAWAYLPQGDDRQLLMRFDLDETWISAPGQRGILFRAVACHEFGHLLGLDHSRQQQALMAPYYRESVVTPQQADDIPRIQSLYGKPTTPTPPPTPPTGKKVITVEVDGNITGARVTGIS